MPPKAKEFESATRIGIWRATLGMASTAHLGSGSRKLIVGGAICSRSAEIVTTSSSPPLAPSAWPCTGFVDETGGGASPKTARIAWDSVMSLA